MSKKPAQSEQIGRNLHALRFVGAWLKHRDITQKQLATRMGASEASVSKWLSGQNTMSVKQFLQIAEVLETTSDALFFPPEEQALAAQYRKAAEIVQKMTPELLATWIAVGEAMAKE